MMIRTMMLIPMVVALLACGLITSTNDPTEEPERNVEVFGEVLAVHYGDTSIEEKIFDKNAIVKATMTSLSSEVFVDAKGKYRLALKFNLDVREYLKGSGPSSIVAVWVNGRRYDTNDEAENAKATTLTKRDDQWDDREAIIFLYDEASSLGASLDARLQLADHFFLALGHRYFDDDRYSLNSTRYKAWLPAASSTGSTGDDQEFLLDVPSASGTTPTITLGDLKTRIAEVTSELAGGDGSEAYRECVRAKYEFERQDRYFQELDGTGVYDKSPQDSVLASGQPAGTMLHERNWYGTYPDTKARTWIEGTDAALFSVMQGEAMPNDSNRDGVLTAGLDEIRYMENFLVDRPLPDGEYEIDRKEVWIGFLVCNFVLSHDWTITVEAPEGTLHEAFFDPVTDGTAVAADGTNGVLKPATFTGTDGAAASVDRIEWESGTVKIEVSPPTGLSGHVLDFIELDGTVSLSLNADQATVDAANDTLSWSVGSQPWDDGDELMLRVRRSTPASAAAQTPAQTSASPLLNGLGDSNAVSAAQACDLMDTPYDTLATLSAPGEERRVEARDSGPDKHMVRTITDPSGTLIVKIEQIIKDRSMYSRRSAPSNPEVYGEWRVVATDLPRSFPLPCLDASSFEEGASGSSDEPHVTSENFLSEQEGAMRNEFWADSTGRPTRARRTFFPPEYDGVSNTETVVAEFTYSGYGEPNIIEAPCANAAPDQADNPDLDSLGLPDCAPP